MRTPLFTFLAALALVSLSAFAVPAFSDQTDGAVAPPAATAPPAPPETVQAVPASSAAAATVGPLALFSSDPDTEIFKRTPVIDGVIEDGEWDTFYTLASEDWQASTFADWDGKNFYVAARSSKPIDFAVALDAGGDGWFHGEDN